MSVDHKKSISHKYFVTWTDLKPRYTSINFLKNKDCSTISDSFKKCME